MLHYDRIDLRKETDVAKSDNSRECIVCHYRYFNHVFKSQNSVCNGCYDLTMMLLLNLNDIASTTVKIVDYCYIIHGISKSEAIDSLENPVLDDRGYNLYVYQRNRY